MVVVPENENSDADYTIEMLPRYLDELEANGYPIDRSRVYVAGMSKGGATTLQVGLECSDIVAAISPHSSSFGMLMEGESIESTLRGEDFYHEGQCDPGGVGMPAAVWPVWASTG